MIYVNADEGDIRNSVVVQGAYSKVMTELSTVLIMMSEQARVEPKVLLKDLKRKCLSDYKQFRNKENTGKAGKECRNIIRDVIKEGDE